MPAESITKHGQWATPHRLAIFTDAVFAVLITILVLPLRPPQSSSLVALIEIWPSALSYAVSYVFIAIIWMSHHYVFRYATEATPALIWSNFANLFAASLIPFATAWMAATHLAPVPVAFYACVSVLVNVTFLRFDLELLDRTPAEDVPRHVRRVMVLRSTTTLCLFALAAAVALKYPWLALGLICCCFLAYLKPEPPQLGKWNAGAGRGSFARKLALAHRNAHSTRSLAPMRVATNHREGDRRHAVRDRRPRRTTHRPV